MSRNSMVAETTSVHQINQLKELRKSMRKMRDQQSSTTKANSNTMYQNSSMMRMEQEIGAEASSSYITFFKNKQTTSAYGLPYEQLKEVKSNKSV